MKRAVLFSFFIFFCIYSSSFSIIYDEIIPDDDGLVILLEKYLPNKIKECKFTIQTKIIVTPFVAIDYNDGDLCEENKPLSAFAQNVLPTILESIFYKYAIVLERRQLKKVIEELSFQYSALSDIEKAKKVGKILGADFIVIGELQRYGCYKLISNDSVNYLNLRIVNVESGYICSMLMFKKINDKKGVIVK